MSFKKLILVDGMAVLYRAHYAIRELSTSSGKPTNAVFGFIRMLMQVRKIWEPSHWVVVFDGGIPKERMDLLPEYKAQRPAMPDILREQISSVEQYLDCAGIKRVRQDATEADDLLASIAVWAEPDVDEVLIATNDKDLYQLVNVKTKIITIGGKNVLMGTEDVRAKTGVNPDQIVEWLALTGDSSDNIPGVPGIGPKTAADLLNKFGSLAGLWAHLEQLDKERLRIALTSNDDILRRNVAMMKLNMDLVCPLIWADIEVKKPDTARLLELMEELEFDSMARELRQKELFTG